MKKLAKRIDQIDPDGVILTINWQSFTPNTSFFIPCINTKEAVRQVREMAKARFADVEFRCREEGGKWGIRFWRVR